jgi:hypothetical protein
VSYSELVKAIFVFDKKSGRPYIRRTFGDFQAEPFLVMGFLNAIMKFAKEVGKSDLKIIDMQDLRIFFTEKENIIFTSITSTMVSPLDLKFKIKTIESIFLEKYSSEDLANISLEIEYFESFIPVIDEIIFGDVRYLEDAKRDQMQKLLEKLKTVDNISGAAIFSFTGVTLATVLTTKQRDIFMKFFNGIFGVSISGITRVIIDTLTYSIYITSLEEDCMLVVFSQDKRFQTFDKKKISETILQVNELIV